MSNSIGSARESNPFVDHIWGVSPALDHLWGQVVGMRSRDALKCSFMVLRAYIDDSYDADGVFVLAGYIANLESWAKFTTDWEEILPLGTFDKNGNHHFKMQEMARANKFQDVAAFYRVIENHTLTSVSCIVQKGAWEEAKSRIHAPSLKLDYSVFDNRYMLAFKCLLDMFHSRKDEFKKIIPIDEVVHFYFDQQSEKSIIHKVWDEYVASSAEHMKARFGTEPRFEDDKKFLPLQAADLWAWWVRKWTSDKELESRMESLDFGHFKARNKTPPRIVMFVDADAMVVNLRNAIKAQFGEHHQVFDLKNDALS
jgi:hypothetical protein